jgi:A/G-specific adenine glycosylase
MSPFPPADQRRRLRRRLQAWFARHQRDLPWRRSRDPYRIWVSEIMLQQTQAATVVAYFERFLAAFPRLADLAAADEQQVLRLWEGLGYYRRARNLHQAARQIVARHAGRFPTDPASAAALPGLGRYTVGAVLSQAFDARLPILEANSQRVLSRLFAVPDAATNGSARRHLWRLAELLLPRRHVGDFNQALMELGALICTPRLPRCQRCPLISECAAHRLGLQEQIPTRQTRAETVEVCEVGLVVKRGKRVLLVQRPNEGRWAGLWEFPHGPRMESENNEKAAARLARQLVGLGVRLGPEIMTLNHGVTHHRITLACFEAAYVAGVVRSPLYARGVWIEPRQLPDFPVSAPQRRLALALWRV